MKMLRHTIAVFALLIQLSAIHGVVAQAAVLEVVNGDAMDVLIGDTVETVRLLYANTPEAYANDDGPATDAGVSARNFLATIAPVDRVVTLYDKGDDFRRDEFGRILALVYAGGGNHITLQSQIIANGHSVFWTADAEPRRGGTVTGWDGRNLSADLDLLQHSAAAMKLGSWQGDRANQIKKYNEIHGADADDPAVSWREMMAAWSPRWGAGLLRSDERNTTESLADRSDQAPPIIRRPNPLVRRIIPMPAVAVDDDYVSSRRTSSSHSDSVYRPTSNGRPKDVFVRAYTRKDGTHVRSHMRSSPRR